MKGKRMEYRMETIAGLECLMVENGTDLHKIPLAAIASWGTLLGEPDPAKVVAAIIGFQEVPVGPGEPNVWTGLYEGLDEGLLELAKAGVPPEHMPDLLDPELGAPVPGPEIHGRMVAARALGRKEIDAGTPAPVDLPPGLAKALEEKADVIAEAQVAFLDDLSPTVEIPQPIAPQSVPEAMDLLNWATLGTVPDILK
jgi:hypothetical protein